MSELSLLLPPTNRPEPTSWVQAIRDNVYVLGRTLAKGEQYECLSVAAHRLADAGDVRIISRPDPVTLSERGRAIVSKALGPGRGGNPAA